MNELLFDESARPAAARSGSRCLKESGDNVAPDWKRTQSPRPAAPPADEHRLGRQDDGDRRFRLEYSAGLVPPESDGRRGIERLLGRRSQSIWPDFIRPMTS